MYLEIAITLGQPYHKHMCRGFVMKSTGITSNVWENHLCFVLSTIEFPLAKRCVMPRVLTCHFMCTKNCRLYY